MGQNREYSKEVREVSDFKTKDILLLLELREYEPTTPLPISSSKFNRGVRQMFEDMEISVKWFGDLWHKKSSLLLELSKTGTYVTYPYLESHESRELVPRWLLPKLESHYLVTHDYQDGFPRYPR